MTAQAANGANLKRNRSVMLLSLCLAAFIINLDTTIVNVALPTLSRLPSRGRRIRHRSHRLLRVPPSQTDRLRVDDLEASLHTAAVTKLAGQTT